MKLSGFTFIRNGTELGFPFEASIHSLLPLVDEFVIVVGHGQDDTLERVLRIHGPKIQVIKTHWNEHLADRGFVYAQQKMIAQYACSGDWAFYLEGDEVLHEEDLPKIKASLETHHENPNVEALVFDYHHFYGSPNWLAASPAWYRRECRVIRSTIRTYAPDGQYWVVMDKNRKGRNPKAALANAHIYHYGHVRKLEQMQSKIDQVSKYWGQEPATAHYDIDPKALVPFHGSHPSVIQNWLRTHAESDFQPDPLHRLTPRERKHRWSMRFERAFGLDLSHKHYTLVR